MDLAILMLGLLVKPEGSNLVWTKRLTRVFKGTPYCRPTEMEVAKESIRPEITLPSLDILIKISPGWPSSYKPTVIKPSWLAMENLWVMAVLSSGILFLAGRKTSALTCLLPALVSSFWLVVKGWERLEFS